MATKREGGSFMRSVFVSAENIGAPGVNRSKSRGDSHGGVDREEGARVCARACRST